jgi:decaprenylphospho-beta-D-ribofuranose 2-oxidase
MMKKIIANWGNYPVMETDEKSFSYSEQLAEVLLQADSVIARGNGRCYGDASLEKNTVSTLRFDKILSFDSVNGIFECQSGITLDKVLEVIVPKGWFLPVTPGTKFITVGGAVASDVHGKNHHVDGSFSAHVQKMDVLLASGETITCSPNLNNDLFWATCGGMGLTGVITTVKFDLKKIETSYIMQKQLKAENLDEILQLFDQYKHYTYSVAWIDCLKKGKDFGRSILMLGEHAKLEDLDAERKKTPLQLPKKKQVTFPFNLPSFVLNQFTVKAFNFFYYGKNLKKEINNIVSYEPFFYPLDAILHWNRGYGKKGFVQYQFVLPLESRQGLIEILKKISDEGLGSFLAVLKVFGQQDGLISFPKEGYTLALDFPVRNGLFNFLEELDNIVLKYDGRIYLSKDARMNPDIFWRSYSNAGKFLGIVKKYNPHFRINSVQARRLNITQ